MARSNKVRSAQAEQARLSVELTADKKRLFDFLKANGGSATQQELIAFSKRADIPIQRIHAALLDLHDNSDSIEIVQY